MNSHLVATSAATGSISTVLFWLARDFAGAGSDVP